MLELDVIQKIALTSGKNDKKKVLQENKDNQRLFELLDASLNFFRKFHMNKFDISNCALDEIDLHDEFIALLNKLEKRLITGNAAKSCVEAFLNRCSDRQQDIYAKVLRKDLKAGFSVDTAAEFFPIPTFDVMLATDGKKCKQLNKIISAGVFVSPKLDGYRCLAVIDNGEVTLYSRNGSEFNNFPSIKESLAKSFVGQSVVLDGEIMSDDFQAMQKTAFADKRGTTVGDVKYHVFDTLIINEWESSNFMLNKSHRLQMLTRIATQFGSEVIAVSQVLVDSLDKVLELEVQYTSLGFEGAMILPDMPYYRGRSSNKLMKFKTMQSQDCIITELYEGDVGSRLQGKMGGITLVQENGAICDCGSGFSDKDREYMWGNHELFRNRIAEIKYQELSKDGVMRFPVFVRFRDMEAGTGKI
ncbi:CDC9 ATP-dependent DNA ligase [uncultured Caudovirales phage]|uniref:DNA ligase n=1 Tax=uncultured Caudovirales phage TaxID=2100421 RepID=A0A6J5KTZ2_9CAUD|nr:CDC9 ATP-dependent DNA ligase [uncultured Caudovirales phage]